jgi:hypothetical protein
MTRISQSTKVTLPGERGAFIVRVKMSSPIPFIYFYIETLPVYRLMQLFSSDNNMLNLEVPARSGGTEKAQGKSFFCYIY